MKKLLVLSIAVLGLAVAMPAMAGDLYAVSKLTTAPQQMTDRQLTTVEGAASCLICVSTQTSISVIAQINNLLQLNIAVLNTGDQVNGALQGNFAAVGQSNN